MTIENQICSLSLKILMKNFFEELFEYNFQSNDQLILRTLESESNGSERSRLLFSHILNAQEIWNTRISQKQAKFGVWQIHDLRDWKAINKNKFETSISIIKKFDLNDKVNYSNTRGDNFESSIRDILFHIINHSTYHRGQIATDFRENDIEPIFSDYIFFKR